MVMRSFNTSVLPNVLYSFRSIPVGVELEHDAKTQVFENVVERNGEIDRFIAPDLAVNAGGP